MILSRITLNLRSCEVARDLADCQQMHRTILNAFPAAASAPRREFGVLFRVQFPDAGNPCVLIQSRRAPDFAHLPDGYVVRPPEIKDVSGAYASLNAGMRLRFRLRANPTRKIETRSTPDGVRRNGRRVELRSDRELLGWIERKAASAGFRLLSVRCRTDASGAAAGDPGAVRGFRGSAGAQRSALRFGSVLFEGSLEILDSQAFRVAVETGIGSAKAYGFGLLSLAGTGA